MTSSPADIRMIAFQGERGAYSEQAALELFGAVDVLPCVTIVDVFTAVQSGKADAGLIPVENSLAGTITDSYDQLQRHSLRVFGETIIAVDHCLLGLPGTEISGLKRVLSHPQALAQCDRYLERLGVEPVAVYDTAGSARIVARSDDRSRAAIAGARAADLYGLDILARSIQSRRENYTRFYAIGPYQGQRGERNKTVLVFGTPDLPGALYRCLGVFAGEDINLCRLESRPSRVKPWQYVFYAEVEAHLADEPMERALSELDKHAVGLSVLGSFSLA